MTTLAEAPPRHSAYVLVLLAVYFAVLLLVVGLNVQLLRASSATDAVLMASAWQDRTKGITFAGMDNRPFKSLRLNDRLKDINAIVFGSSTAMGIDETMFPEPMRVYNFSHNSNPMAGVLAQAEYLVDRAPQLKHMGLPIEWATGFVYVKGLFPPADLSPEGVRAAILQAEAKRPLLDEIADSVSFARVWNLAKTLKAIVVSGRPLAAFRETFFGPGGSEYVCPDGLAKDFDPSFRGKCAGFLADGSTRFRHLGRVRDAVAAVNGLTAETQYIRNLLASRGETNPQYLEKVASLAARLRARGGDLFVFMPPLLSGLEEKVLSHPVWSAYLSRTKTELAEWAAAANVVLLDAGPAEKFGCLPAEFVDGHHADHLCFRKVFDRFWTSHGLAAGRIVPINATQGPSSMSGGRAGIDPPLPAN